MTDDATLLSCLKALLENPAVIWPALSRQALPGASASAPQNMLPLLRKEGLEAVFLGKKDDLPPDYAGPLAARIENGWVALARAPKQGEERLEVFDPRAGTLLRVRTAQFLDRWQGESCLFFRSARREAPRLMPPGNEKKGPEGEENALEKGASWPTGLRCLCLIGRRHGLELEEERVAAEAGIGREEPTFRALAEAGRAYGLTGRELTLDWERATGLGQAYPALARKKDGSAALLCNMEQGADGRKRLLIMAPRGGGAEVRTIDQEEFGRAFTGEAILFKRRHSLADPDQPFGIGWFLPAFLSQKRLFLRIGAATLLILGISLLTPLFFQLVIDRVLPHRTYGTLNVLAAGMLIAILYNAGLEFLKSWLLYFATSKIDMTLAERTFRHLMRLPLGFFENIPAGLVLKHMQQTEKIRGFLSGTLFSALLDALSLVIFLPVLLLYSARLTAVVLGFSLALAAIVLILVRPFQRRLDRLYRIEGRRQSRLVESIRGIHTLKSLAVEPQEEREWNDASAQAIGSWFEVGKISLAARAASQFLELAMGVAIVWYGSHLVFDMALTIGALVAFQMISGRVSSPLVKLVSLVHEYQQAALSVRMLGVVMNTPPERSSGSARPRISGTIEFCDVTFRYRPDLQPALRDLSLRLQPGEILGVAGRSGSGKSTLARLLQAMYLPQEGFIRLDGVDIRELDRAHLRRQVGIVLQENYFFHGTIRDNIRLAKPRASAEEVIEAARLAGAHGFISRLHIGYDTLLEENAVNLSGGQKQRLALARTLITRPAVLILDEATSALDPESEWEIQKNIGRMAEGKTLIIISHRLSLMRQSDRIIVLEGGRIAEEGTHAGLLKRPGLYRSFWRRQMGETDA